MTFPKPLTFLKGIFSESDGTPSYGRLFSGVTTLFTCGWVTHVVTRTHAIPDLTGPATFIGVGVSAQYGVNKVASAITSFSGNGKPKP